MVDAFTIHSIALPAAAKLAGFHGSEGISRLYRFDVFLVMVDDVGHDFDLRSAVGAKATLRLERRDGRPSFLVNGIFASMELVSDFRGRSVFRAVLVPRFWHLTHSLHSRIFTEQALPAILGAVLDQGGLAGAYTLELLGSYATQEHVCQYHESDFDFVSRWMEREGLYYYFEQDDEEERLIVTDQLSTRRVLGDRPVRYFPQAEGVLTADAFRAFTCRCSSLPASVRLKDYDYAKPTFEIAGQAPVSPSGVGQISVHGSRFFTPDEGAHLARVKAQSLLAGEVVYQGSGAAPHLRPGYVFELEDHPRAAFNTTYRTTELEHWANQLPGSPELEGIIAWDDVYRVEATAISANVQYRARQQTAWPRIYGGEHAVIDGPAVSEYAQIDSHGRYAVKFHFDESDLGGGKASTWVRMLQPHGGGIEGFHFPLRVGTEVVCTFSGGDPDRPSIVGVAPNALTPSPVTSSNHTRNVIQTGGRNRLELEDRAGQERVTMSTPHTNTYLRMGAPNDDHNITLHTDGKTLHDTGTDLDIEVGGKMTEGVKGTVTVTYDSTMDEQVLGAVTETYLDSRSLQVGGGPLAAAPASLGKGNMSTVIFGNETRHVHGTSQPTYEGNVKETYNADRSYDVKGAYNQKIHKNSTTTTVGNFATIIEGSSSTVVLGNANNNCEGLRTTSTGGAAITFTLGGSANVVVGGAVTAVTPWSLNAVAGIRTNFTYGPQFSINTGLNSSVVTGVAFSNITGGKLENIEGFKLESVTGANLKSTNIEIIKSMFKAEHTDGRVAAGEFKLVTRALGMTASDWEVVL